MMRLVLNSVGVGKVLFAPTSVAIYQLYVSVKLGSTHIYVDKYSSSHIKMKISSLLLWKITNNEPSTINQTPYIYMDHDGLLKAIINFRKKMVDK